MTNVPFVHLLQLDMYRGLRPKMTVRIFIKILGLAFLEYVRLINSTVNGQ